MRRVYGFTSNLIEIELVMARHVYIRVGSREKMIEWGATHKLFNDDYRGKTKQ